MLTSILRNTKVTTGFESQRAMSESMRPFSQLSASDLVHAAMTLLLEEDDLCGDSPIRKKRTRHDRTSIWDSVWGRLLQDPAIDVEGSFSNRKFRRRLNVSVPPAVVFSFFVVCDILIYFPAGFVSLGVYSRTSSFRCAGTRTFSSRSTAVPSLSNLKLWWRFGSLDATQ